MSIPKIPDILPEINLCKTDMVNMLIASIALEEIGLSNILETEGKKIQKVIENEKYISNIDKLLEISTSAENILDKIYKIENLLVEKLKIIKELD